MQKTTGVNGDTEVICVGITNGFNKYFSHLLDREKFYKYDDSLREHFLSKGEAYSSVPMVDIELVDFIPVPVGFASDDRVIDEDANQKLMKLLKEKGLEHLIPEMEEKARKQKEEAPFVWKALMEKKPIDKKKYPQQYEFMRKKVLEPPFIPHVHARPGFYQKPKETEWKSGRVIYSIATTVPKLTEEDVFRVGYFQVIGEFLTGCLDPYIKQLQHIIHYGIHIVPQEWKVVIFLAYSPIKRG